MTSPSPTVTAHAPTLTQRRILFFWIPLAASWLLMGSEQPFANAMIARLSDAQRMIAAFGIVGSLSITIESPVIMLLSTSTALARSRQNYLMLRRFTLHLIVATTLVHFLLSWTPLFDVVVRGWMGVPESIVEPIRLGMRIMIFWSSAIAWRRFKQGIMIRYGMTRYVGQGSILRLGVSAGTALMLAWWGGVPGVAVGACALSIGVIIEAIYAHWMAGDIIREKFGVDQPVVSSPHISYGELVKFHSPLAASSLLFLLTQPLVSAALSRVPNPEVALAAWPVTAGVLFITRAPALALPEVIIALMDEDRKTSSVGAPTQAKYTSAIYKRVMESSFTQKSPLRNFSVAVGIGCALVLALVSFTPVSHFYFRTLIGVSEELASIAVIGGQIGIMLPLIMGYQSWLRGLLTSKRATLPITMAMVINLSTMAVTLIVGVALRLSGVPLAAFALTLSSLAETILLWIASKKN